MLIDHARRKHRPLYEVWYDFRNAFGSVPLGLLWDALERTGVPAEYIAAVQGLYDHAAFMVGNAVDGSTAPILQRVGVFQGCPLSPPLFSAAISPLLHALQLLPSSGVQLSGDDRPGVSAYADDLKTFSGTKAGVTEQHELVAMFLRWTGMAANPAKCRSMGVRRNGNGAIEADHLELALDDTPIPTLTHLQSYTYLGIGDGFDHVRRRVALAPKLKLLKQDATALMESGLAPWQVVKAVKGYLYPRVEYALRHLRPDDQLLESFDLHLRRGLRHLLRLPKSANNDFVYAPVSRGGLGFLPLVELHAALQIAHGWQMINSPDPAIRRIAREQLHQVADARHRLDKDHWKQRGDELCELLLNGELGTSAHAPPKRRNGDIGSLWVDVRKNLKAFGLKLATAPADPESGAPAKPLQLRVPHHAEWLDHRNVLRHVKQHMKNKRWRAWCSHVDQGRTARAHGGVGSGFLTRPRGMWESDYRFAVAARLNMLDTVNVLARRRLRAHDRCRHPGCRWKETLAHVLNHCPGTMDSIRGRHDDALKEIERTLHASSGDRQGRTELRTNQTVPGLAGPALRPDLQVYNHDQRTVAVVDLAIAFDEQPRDDPESSGLAKAAAEKKAKYAGIKRHLERQGWKVHLSALVYGSLGSVAPSNYKVYTEHLGLLKRDAKRLDRQLSVACIQSSRRIWNLHCAQHRARQHQDQPAPRGRRVTETGGTPSRTDRR
uniref:Reverse transcriptase domain-containing protein n=1 Tax=Phytophthora ramorum TaxID=164328 RepID=H3GYD3_PHYRM